MTTSGWLGVVFRQHAALTQRDERRLPVNEATIREVERSYS